ncbi:MAG: type III-B CRISPR module RAMP protein Cmr6 [candidate division WOR-3 bacterium]|nr:type III-B CRISPR module RAMP protein Cmr6 [candidate division WOR-3 bacterium]
MKSFNELSNYSSIENTCLYLSKLIKNDIIQNSKNKKFFLSKIPALNKFSFSGIKKSIISNSESQGFIKVYDNILNSSSPLICGLGLTSVLEISITLHHIWGVPYIPGSSLKGVCRQVAFWKLLEEKGINEKNKIRELQDKFYGNLDFNDEDILESQLLFGAGDFKGLLLFLDVYPEIKDTNPFRLDIMNPHYSSYYSDDSGKTPPGDWENPVPIYFITVKEGIPFNFTILFDQYRWEKVKERMNISNEIKNKIETLLCNGQFFNEVLKEALANYGLGSKTRLGYGNFQV